MAVKGLIELTLDTFLAALAKAGRDEPHRVFASGAHYIPPSLRTQLSTNAAHELGRLGLLDGDELSEEFAHTLQVVDRPHTEYFAHVRTGRHHYGVLVAAWGRADAVTAVSEDDVVWLKPASEEDLTKTLTAHLPDFPAANIRPFSVERQEFANDDMDFFGPGPSRSRDADSIERILSPPFDGTGYLHVARRPDGTGRVQAEQAVPYVDTDQGRVGFAVTGPADNQHIVAFPGDPASLAERLVHLRRALT